MDKNSKKKEIRKEILKHRRSLTEEEIRSGSHAIAEKILSMEVYQKAEAVYLYIDCKGEASVREIYEAALRDDKRIAAPRVHGEDMTFYYIHSMEEDLEPGYFAIPGVFLLNIFFTVEIVPAAPSCFCAIHATSSPRFTSQSNMRDRL